jgi:hypothetical protein
VLNFGYLVSNNNNNSNSNNSVKLRIIDAYNIGMLIEAVRRIVEELDCPSFVYIKRCFIEIGMSFRLACGQNTDLS